MFRILYPKDYDDRFKQLLVVEENLADIFETVYFVTLPELEALENCKHLLSYPIPKSITKSLVSRSRKNSVKNFV